MGLFNIPEPKFDNYDRAIKLLTEIQNLADEYAAMPGIFRRASVLGTIKGKATAAKVIIEYERRKADTWESKMNEQ